MFILRSPTNAKDDAPARLVDNLTVERRNQFPGIATGLVGRMLAVLKAESRCSPGTGSAWRAIRTRCAARRAAADSKVVTLDVTANRCYRTCMIVSFKDKRTREFAEGRHVKALSGFSRQVEMK